MKAILLTILAVCSNCLAVGWTDVAAEWLETDSYADVNKDGIVNYGDYALTPTGDTNMAILYIDEVNGVDATAEAGDITRPYKLLDTAYNAASDGDTLMLLSDLTPLVQAGGANWRWAFDRANIDITIDALVPRTITFVYAGSYGVYLSQNGALNIGSNVTVNGAGTAWTFYKLDNSGTPNGGFALHGSAIGGTERLFYFFDCAWFLVRSANLVAAANLLEARGAFSKIVFDDCSINHTGAGSLYALDFRYSTLKVDYFQFTNNTGSVGIGGIMGAFPNGGYTLEKTQVYISGNSLDKSVASGQPVISLGLEYGAVAAWAVETAYLVDAVKSNDGQLYKCAEAHTSAAADEPGTGANWRRYWVVYDTITPVVFNNEITGGSSSHSVAVFFGANKGLVAYNTVSGGNYQIVVKSSGNTIHHNKAWGAFPISVFSGGQNDVHSNTCYATSGAALTLGDQDGNFTRENRVYDNILVATGDAYCISDDTDSADRDNYVDHNCYYSAGTAFAELSGSRTTFAALKAQWAAQAAIFTGNDQNSVNINPMLNSYYESTNSQLIGAGVGGEDIGAKVVISNGDIYAKLEAMDAKLDAKAETGDAMTLTQAAIDAIFSSTVTTDDGVLGSFQDTIFAILDQVGLLDAIKAKTDLLTLADIANAVLVANIYENNRHAINGSIAQKLEYASVTVANVDYKLSSERLNSIDSIDVINSILQSNAAIDTTGNNYQLVLTDKDTGAELSRKDLKDIDGNLITSTKQIIAQHTEPAA